MSYPILHTNVERKKVQERSIDRQGYARTPAVIGYSTYTICTFFQGHLFAHVHLLFVI